MQALDVIAVVMAVSILVKVLVYALAPRRMIKIIKNKLSNLHNLKIAYLFTILFVGYFAVKSMSASQIGVGVFLGICLSALMLVNYPESLKSMVSKMSKNPNEMFSKNWMAWTLSVGLALWILYSIFVA